MRFDWEPRPTPEGLLQIARNQKREASDQSLRHYTTQSSEYKSRSQWEEASQRKAQLVARTLREQEQRPLFEDKNASEKPAGNLPVADFLRQELEEKRSLRAAEKEAAAQRRETLLQQAAAMAAARESQREAQAQKHRVMVLKESVPEVREYTRKINAKELAAEWDQIQKEKLLVATTTESGGHYEERSTAAGASSIFQGGQVALSNKDQKQAQKEILNNLKLQLEESQRRKAEEQSNNAAMEAALRQQWQRDEEATRQNEQEKTNMELQFQERAEVIRVWEAKQLELRVMAEAEAEKQLLAGIKLRQQQDTALDSRAKLQQQEDMERQLQDCKARKQALNATIEDEKRSETDRLAQEAEKYAESLKEQRQRRQQQAQDILNVNQALQEEAQRRQNKAKVEERTYFKSRMDENAGQISTRIANSKQAQRAEAVKISSELAAQIVAKEVKIAAQKAIEQTRKDKEKLIEEEKKRLVAEALTAYKLLR